MKHLVPVILVVIIGLSACAPTVVETQIISDNLTQADSTEAVSATQQITNNSGSQSTEIPAGDEQITLTPTIDVDALIREKLNNNHSIDRVYDAQKTREEWNTTLNRMIGYGAKISEEEKHIIIDYLLSR